MATGIFAGIITIDIQFLVPEYPPPNTKVKAHNNDVSIGGPATNAGITFSHLGGSAHLLTGIGNHHFTGMMQQELAEYEVDYTDIKPECTLQPTFASIITSEENGDRTVFSYNPRNLNAVKLDIIDQLNMESYDFVMIDGFYMNFALELAQKAKASQIPVILDGGSWKPGMEELLKYVDIPICSDHFYPPGTQSSYEVIEALHRYPGVRHVAITRGDQPILYSSGKGIATCPVQQPHQIIDTLGAGDVFHGAFGYYYTETKEFKDSLYRASSIAGQSCEHLGTKTWMSTGKYV